MTDLSTISKGFDIVDHVIILKILSNNSFSDKALALRKSKVR